MCVAKVKQTSSSPSCSGCGVVPAGSRSSSNVVPTFTNAATGPRDYGNDSGTSRGEKNALIPLVLEPRAFCLPGL